MVFIWYLYGIYMVFTSEEERTNNEGKSRYKGFFYGFSWGNIDFCLSLQTGKSQEYVFLT